jgi:hypothetical protein
MKNKIFILSISNILLFVYIYFHISEEPKETSLSNIITSTLPHISKIEILESPSSSIVISSDKDGSWQLLHPVRWEADSLKVAELITSLANLRINLHSSADELATRGEELSDYGITDGAPLLKIDGLDTHFSLQVGDTSRDKTFLFCLFKNNTIEDTILKLPISFLKFFDSQTITWANTTFFKIPLYTIDSLKLRTINHDNQSTVELVNEEDDWKFNLPLDASANREKLFFVLNQIASSKIINFKPELKDGDNITNIYHLRVDAMSRSHLYTFSLIENNSTSMLICDYAEKGIKFQLLPELRLSFEDWTTKLREPRLFDVTVSDLERIKISRFESSLSLRRTKENEWIGFETNGTTSRTADVDLQAVRETIHKLSAIEVTDYLQFNPNSDQLSEHGFDQPIFKLELEYLNSTRRTVLVSKSSDQMSLWKTLILEEGVLCLTNCEWEDMIRIEMKNYLSKNVVKLGSAISEISIQMIDDMNRSVYSTVGQDDESFNILKNIYAESIVDERMEKEGLWHNGNWHAWKYKVNFIDKNSSSPQSVLITEQVNTTNWFAGSLKENITFNLPIEYIDTLSSILQSSN